jgi:hypothetical protein
VAFPSPTERIAEPGIVYFGVVLRRRPERSDRPEGPFLDTRVFSLPWRRGGWAPDPNDLWRRAVVYIDISKHVGRVNRYSTVIDAIGA